jgi:ribosomal protein S12 methylthiotransferase
MAKVSAENKTVFLVALGCPKNFVDSEIIAGTLAADGWIPVSDPQDASLYVVNTCAFLPQAREEAVEEISLACSWKDEYPQNRTVVVAGCLPEFDRKNNEYRKAFADVDIWLGVDEAHMLPQLIDEKSAAEITRSNGAGEWIYDENTPRMMLTLPHLSSIKIAEGCNNRCSYCSIPGIRGKLRSRTSDSVVREADMLVKNGVREIMIIAQDITAFGNDTGESLAGLLRRIENEVCGDFVIRLLYTHPAHYTDELIETIAASEKILPYIDIPLQHISDKILKSMNRHTDRKSIEALIAKLRASIKGLTLRTTFITGLPGEGEKEFKELADFIRDTKFERLGVFTYSPEPGTPAAAMPDQVPHEIAEERAQILMRRQSARMKRKNRKLIGSEHRVLVDSFSDDGKWAFARGAMDAAQIDNCVIIPAHKKMRCGEFYKIKVCGTYADNLWGKVIKK